MEEVEEVAGKGEADPSHDGERGMAKDREDIGDGIGATNPLRGESGSGDAIRRRGVHGAS